MDWKGLIRIEGDFDLLGIQSPSIHMNWGGTEQAVKRQCLKHCIRTLSATEHGMDCVCGGVEKNKKNDASLLGCS
jgi:hypothetical protein